MHIEIENYEVLRKLKHDINSSTNAVEKVMKLIQSQGFNEKTREILSLALDRIEVLKDDQDKLYQIARKSKES